MIVKEAALPVPHGITTCRLYNTYGPSDSPKLLDHIAEHLHDFALRSLPWPTDGYGDENGTRDLGDPYINADDYFDQESEDGSLMVTCGDSSNYSELTPLSTSSTDASSSTVSSDESRVSGTTDASLSTNTSYGSEDLLTDNVSPSADTSSDSTSLNEANVKCIDGSAPDPLECLPGWAGGGGGGGSAEPVARWPVNEDAYQDPDLEADPSVDYFGLWSER